MAKTPDPAPKIIEYDVDGTKFFFDNLTLDELAELERELDCYWGSIRTNGVAAHSRAVLARFYARELGLDAALVKVGAFTLEEYYDHITWVDDPKAGDVDPKGQPESTPNRSK